ncbi:sugar ABC transporter permease [Devosia algicola]|uniref:Sugar ABC transporter permease n=1 Tax=Devosia algicola TaxID=3026418 RepID=A0ABY7YL04_9HYPH|nr:sugar ABC transporter permease [Devosia algicola]WDR01985.1 sugar ABC transporter permease [Devosia algicola]
MTATDTTSATAWRPSRRRSRERLRESLYAAVFLAPNVLGIGLFVVVPVIAGLAISFTNWDLLGEASWIGIDNYVALWSDALFWTSLRNTLFYTVLVIPGGLILSLLLALGLSGKMRGIRFYQAIFFLPYVSSTVAIALVWKWIYNPDYGVLNVFLRGVGLPAPNWLGDPTLALVSIAIVSIWQTAGYNMVLFVAGLRAIPKHYYEAARIDGAGPITIFFKITLPLLMPTIFFVSATSLIASFQVFNLVFVMTKGGRAIPPASMCSTFGRTGFRSSKWGTHRQWPTSFS